MKSSQKITPAVSGAELSPDPRARLAGLVLALVTVLVYLPVCFHDFIFFDDPSYVSDNPIVQGGLTWAGFKWVFLGWHASNWHPLTWLSHQLDCQLFGLNPGAHHFVNVLFHAANAALIFRLWLRLTNAFWPAVLVAALFAWHPLHVESVAWISERKDVLSTFFGLLAMLAYVRYAMSRPPAGKRLAIWQRDYFLALVFFALSLMAKPMLVTLPFLLLLLDHWPLRRNWQLLEKGPFFLLTAISCVVTFLAQRGQAVVSLQQFTLGQRLESALIACLGYLGKLVWPVGLGIFYPRPDHYSIGVVVLAAVLLAAISLFAWQLRKTHGYFLTGWLWFLGMLVPVIGLVQVGDQAMADRYTYLPAVGFFVAVVFGVSGLAARLKSSKAIPGVAAGLALAACVAVTEHQLAFWRDTETLFTHTLAVTGHNGPAHMMLGVAYERQGREDDAMQQYQEALSCDPSLFIRVEGGVKRPLAVQVQLLLGQSSEKNGRVDEAIAHYREVLRLDPSLVDAHNNLGNLFDEQGKSDEALVEYQTAVRLQPNLPQMYENLGTQLAKLGRMTEAMHEFDEAVRLEPGASRPFYLMGKAYLRSGLTTEAIAKFQEALQHDPDDFHSLTFLARIYAADENAQVRNGAQALAFAEKANTLTHGEQPFVLGALAMAYAEVGRFTEAQQTARTALELAVTARQDLAGLQAQLHAYESHQPWRQAFTNAPPSSAR